MNIIKLANYTILSGLIISMSAHALVDYSEGDETPNKIESSQKFVKKNDRKSASKNAASFDFGTNFEEISVAGQNGGGRASIAKVQGKFQTGHNIYFDFNYWAANSSDANITSNSSYQKGNPTFVLGFNWLELGTPQEAVNVDIYGGLMIPQKDSAFASTRTDKIVGIETSKRFMEVAVGIGFEYKLTGTPSDSSELAIGNIQKLSAAIGWQVSGDIRLQVEASRVDISPYQDLSRYNALRKKISYGQMSPSLQLGIAQFIHLDLGARFQTQKIKSSESVVDARLWSNEGSYGNSIFAGLGVGI